MTRRPPFHRRSALRPALFSSVAILALGAASQAFALPQNPNIVVGSGGGTSFDGSTPNTLVVNQNDNRVVIDWESFDIANGETVTFNQSGPNAIAFNIVTGTETSGPPIPPLTTIDGNLNAGGGVFLFSSGGIVFGPNARVDVGTFVAGTGVLDEEGSDLFGDCTDGCEGALSFYIDASDKPGDGFINVNAGATINANSGYVVLQSEDITQNGAITALDGVGYIVAEQGRIDFFSDDSGQYLAGIAASAVTGRGRPAFSQGASGSTSGYFVSLKTPNGDVEDGYHGVINIDGTVEATGLNLQDGTAIELRAGNPTWPDTGSHNDSVWAIDASNATITAASGDVVVRASDTATLGAVTASDGSLDVDSYLGGSLNGAIDVGGSVLVGTEASEDLFSTTTVNASVKAAHNIFIYGDTLDVTSAGSIDAGDEADLYGYLAVNVNGSVKAGGIGDIEANAVDGEINLDASVTTGAELYLLADNISTTGTIDAGSLFATSYGDGITIGGPTTVHNDAELDVFSANGVIKVTNSLDVGGDLTIDLDPDAGGFGPPPPPVPTVVLTGDITVGGAASFTTYRPDGDIYLGNLTVDGGLILTGVDIYGSGNVTVGGAATMTADNTIALDGTNSFASLDAGSTTFSAGALTTTGGDLSVSADSIDITGVLHVGRDALLTTPAYGSGSIHFGDDVFIGRDAILTSASVTADGSWFGVGRNLTDVSGRSSAYNGQVSAGGAIDVEKQGDDFHDASILFGSSVHSGGALTASATVDSSAGPRLADVGFIGPITANGAVSLTAHAKVFGEPSGGGRIHFEGGLQSFQGLTADADEIEGHSFDVTGIASLTALDDITLTGTNSTLSSASIHAGTDGSGVLDASGSLTTGGDLSVSAPSVIFDTSGNVGGDASISGNQVRNGVNTTGGDLHVGGDLQISARSQLQYHGDIDAHDISLTTNEGGGGDIEVAGLAAKNVLSVHADGAFSASGAVSTGAASTITAGDDLTLAGTSSFIGDTHLNADPDSGKITIGGAMDVQGDLSTVSFSLETTAPISVSGDFNIDPGGDIIFGAATDVVGNANFATADGIYVNGDLTVGGTLDLTAGTVVESTAKIASTGALTVNGPGGISLGGQTDAPTIALTSAGAVSIDGPLTAGSLAVSADSFSSSGLITLAGGFSLTTNNAIAFGPAVINGDLSLTTNNPGAALSTSGALTVHGDLILAAHSDFNTPNTITLGANAQVDGDVQSNGDFFTSTTVTGPMNVGGAFNISGRNVLVQAPITVGDTLWISVGGDITFDAASGAAGRSVVHGDTLLGADGDVILGSELHVGGDLGLYGGEVSSTGTGALRVDGNLTSNTFDFNTAGAMDLRGNADITGEHITFGGPVTVTGALDVSAFEYDGSFTENGGLTVGGDTQIAVHTSSEGGDPGFPSGSIVLNGQLTSGGTALLAVYGQDDVSPDGVIAIHSGLTAGATTLFARDVTFSSTSSTIVTGDATLQASHDLTLDGPMNVGGSIGITAGNAVGVTGDVTVGHGFTASSLTFSQGSGSDIEAGGSAGITGTSGVTLSGQLMAGTAGAANASLQSGGKVTVNGAVGASGDLTVNADSLTGGAGSSLQGGNNVSITAVHGINDQGSIAAGARDLTLTSTDLASNVGVHSASAGRDLIANTGHDITLAGGAVGRNATITGHSATSLVALAGVFGVGGDLTTNSFAFLNPGAVSVGGDLSITAIADIQSNGALTVSGDASLVTNTDVLVHAAVTVGGDLGIQARDVVSTGPGDISAIGSLTLNATRDVSALGDIGAHDGQITAGGNVTLAGATTIGTDLGITANGASSLILVSGPLSTGGDLTTDSFAFRNTGAITVGGALSIDPGGDIIIDAPLVVAGDADLTTNDNILVHASVTVGGNLTMNATDLISTAPGVFGVNGSITGNMGGGIQLAGAMTAGGAIDLEGFGAGVYNANIQAGGNLTLSNEASITVGSGVTLRAAAGGGGSTLTLTSGGDITAATNSLLVAGPAQGAISGTVNLTGGGLFDGDMTLGAVMGRYVNILNTGGAVTLNGAVASVADARVFNRRDPDSGAGGDVTVNAGVSGGNIAIINGGGSVVVAGGASVQSALQTYVQASDDIAVNGSVSGGAAGLYATGVLTVGANGAVTTTGTTTAPTWPVAPSNAAFQTENPIPVLSGLTLAAHAMTLNGAVTAGPSNNRSDVFIQPLGSQSSVTIGGSGSSGFNLTSASFGHITARNVIVLGGAGDGRGTGYDLTLADLTVDGSKVGGLWLGTQSAHKIVVSGTVGGTGAVRLGFAQTLDGVDIGGDTTGPPQGSTLLGYIPGEIDITGGLGTGDSPLSAVSLIARNNIFMGSSAFIDAARADSAFDATKHSSDFAIPTGHLFVSSGTLDLAAQGRIIQQDTAPPGAFSYSGIAIDTPTSAHPLISSASVLEGKAFGLSSQPVWTAHFGAGPTAIDLFGSLDTGTLPLIADESAARQPFLLSTGMTSQPSYRINTCVFGATCVRGYEGDPGRVETPNPDDPNNPIDPDILTQLLTEGALAPLDATQVLPIKLDEDEDQKKNQTPITGSGNGDLWGGGPAPQ